LKTYSAIVFNQLNRSGTLDKLQPSHLLTSSGFWFLTSRST